MNKICGIYKITSPSGRIYIGQSRDIKRRMSSYKNLRCKDQSRIYNSIMKYGWENHKFEIIHECEESKLNELEAYYIKFYDTFDSEHGLNLTSGGDSYKLSDERKQKLSLNFKGKHHSNESKEKLRLARQGKKHSIDSIEKMKLIKLGKNLSLETKEKLKIINTGKIRSNETKKKISLSKLNNKIWLGKKHSEESKLKISEARISTYEIYNNENKLVLKFKSNFRKEIKKLNLPKNRFENSYRTNEKILNGKYKGWYAIKL